MGTLSTKENIWLLCVYVNYYKIIFTFFLYSVRTNVKNINLDDKNIKKCDFYKNKKASQLVDVDVNKILVSKKEPYGTKNALKYFIGYNDNDVIRPLYLRLPQMIGYARKSNENTTVSFRVNNNNKQLLKNYNKIWGKVEKLLKMFERKPVYGDDDKYIKTKVKKYAGRMITNFHNKKMPKEKAPYKCLSIIILDSVIKANKKYYPQTLLEGCKYEQKIENLIDDELEKSESDNDANNKTEPDNDDDNDNAK